ncbi:hypothetical protein Avbf_17530 [Armadillidium vulgare]|nr:hypothetical protein Avbf_17530 [Armadillidium vulgare]
MQYFICVHSCDDLIDLILFFHECIIFTCQCMIMLFITDDDLKWFESLLTIFHLVLKFFPPTNKKLTKIWGMENEALGNFTLVNSAKYTLTILHLTALIQELDLGNLL